MDLPEYSYTPLTSSGEIRMLYLHPGTADEVISVTLEHVNLKNPPKYEALSYVWGVPQREQIVVVNDELCTKVTPSLIQALRDIRDEDRTRKPRPMWVDSICINQDDIEERQQQVSIMGAIYRHARNVLTYIGPEYDDSSLAIDFAHTLVKYGREHMEQPDPRLHMVEQLSNLGFPPADDMRWKALKSLIKRPWASRCWCAQEFMLNRRLIMMCGRKKLQNHVVIPELILLVFMRKLPVYAHPVGSEDPNSIRECLSGINKLRLALFSGSGRLPLLTLLIHTHPLLATDPRDKIYSLIGLSFDQLPLRVRVDYTLPVEKLYTQVAASICATYQTTLILYSNLGRKSLTLPSWVPDWSTWRFGSHDHRLVYTYEACGNTKSSITVDLTRSSLHIEGSIVDSITSLTEPIDTYYTYEDDPRQQTWIQEQIQLARSLQPYPDGSNTTDVLWRTLIGNMDFAEEEAGDDYVEFFQAHANLTPSSSDRQRDMAREFRDTVRRRSRYRRLSVCKMGYLGVVPETAEIGDLVCMFGGARSLFTIRKMGSAYILVGPAYFHGLMKGEVLALEDFKMEVIVLV